MYLGQHSCILVSISVKLEMTGRYFVVAGRYSVLKFIFQPLLCLQSESCADSGRYGSFFRVQSHNACNSLASVWCFICVPNDILGV